MQKILIISIVIFIAVALVLYAQQSAIPKDFESITAEEVKKKIMNKDEILLLDVRTPGEFNGPLGHIEGAILIPVQSLADSIGKLDKYKDTINTLSWKDTHRDVQYEAIEYDKPMNMTAEELTSYILLVSGK